VRQFAKFKKLEVKVICVASAKVVSKPQNASAKKISCVIHVVMVL
jgi:hypothetical protein